MNKKVVEGKVVVNNIVFFAKSFSEPCISEMIYLFYIFWDQRINVIWSYMYHSQLGKICLFGH